MVRIDKDFLVVLLFSIFLVIRPISYQEMREKHPILENQTLTTINSFNSSLISNEFDEFDELDELDALDALDELDELDALDALDALDELDELDELDAFKSNQNMILFAKDISNSGGSNFFADALSPPLPSRQQRPSTTGLGAGGGGGGGSGGAGGAGAGDNPTTNSGKGISKPRSYTHHPRFPYEKPKPKEGKRGKLKPGDSVQVKFVDGQIVLRITRDNKPVFLEQYTIYKKIYHWPDFGIKIPDTVDVGYAMGLPPRQRINYLKERIPQKTAVEVMKAYRDHILDPNTQFIEGTIGKNKVAEGKWKEVTQGTHLYNPENNLDMFFANNGRNYSNEYQTGMKLSNSRIEDLKNNNNTF